MKFRNSKTKYFTIVKNEGKLGWVEWDSMFKTLKEAEKVLARDYIDAVDDNLFRIIQVDVTLLPVPEDLRYTHDY